MDFTRRIALIILPFLSLAACNSAKENPKVPPQKIIQEESRTGEDPIAQERITPREDPISEEEPEDYFPLEGFVLDLKAKSGVILKLELTSVDSVHGSIKVFHGKVLKTYKGEAPTSRNISFMGMVDADFSNAKYDTLLVFLEKYNKPLSPLSRKNVLYGTIEENAIMSSNHHIEKLLAN